MMRSLTSGVAGLRAHQTKMDVIGNNIANVNTYGFKASRVTFADVYYQTISGAAEGNSSTGGMNPTQIGYGAMIRSIDRLDSPTGAAGTDRPMDIYLTGEGLITTKSGDEIFYTRLGVLRFDPATGNLLDAGGNFVQGMNYKVDTPPRDADGVVQWISEVANFETDGVLEADLQTVNIDTELLSLLTNISIDKSGKVTGILTSDWEDTAGKYATAGFDFEANDVIVIGNIALANFGNSEGMIQVGDSYLQKSTNAGAVTYARPGTLGTGQVKAGYLEMSNVDISKEFTDMITTQRGFQANTRIITVSDEMLQELVNLKR